MRGLYAICDVDFLKARGVEPLAFVEAVLQARPAALQVRAKSLGARATLELLHAVRARCEPLGVPIFANDRPDLALLARCSGVHLGQSDLSLADARRFAPGLRLGVSTHHLAQVTQALEQRPHYLAFGPVFATSTKVDADPIVGLTRLAEAARSCRQAGVPLVAIGGISLERAPAVAEHADAAAVISALLPASGLGAVASAAARLHFALSACPSAVTGDADVR